MFSPGPRQVILLAVADPDTNKATLLTPVDWNHILDNGCPKSAGGLENVISLSMALGFPVHLLALDCAPFYHGYGEACSDSRLTIGIWNLPLVDLNGVEFRIPFYVFLGSGPLLLGNSVLRNSRIDGTKHLLIITEKAGLSKTPLILQIYTTDSLRTHHVIPCRTDQMCKFFQSVYLLPPAPTPTDQNNLMQEITASLPSACMEQPTFHLWICALSANVAVFGLPGSNRHCPMLFLYFSRVN
jgi:hypothetical protein